METMKNTLQWLVLFVNMNIKLYIMQSKLHWLVLFDYIKIWKL